MQTIRLQLDHSIFHCPVTGHLIRDYESFKTSPATVFVYVDEIGDFAHIVPDLNKIWEKTKENRKNFQDELESFERFAGGIDDDAIVCFEITTSEMGCGPVSSTIRIGIDMNYCDEDPGSRPLTGEG